MTQVLQHFKGITNHLEQYSKVLPNWLNVISKNRPKVNTGDIWIHRALTLPAGLPQAFSCVCDLPVFN